MKKLSKCCSRKSCSFDLQRSPSSAHDRCWIDSDLASIGIITAESGLTYNDYEQHIGYAEYRKLLDELSLSVPTHEAELAPPQADNIKIGNLAPVMRSV